MAAKTDYDQDWNAFKNGSKVAFAKIYHDYINDLLKYGYNLHGNRSIVEDCAHDLFIELWKGRENLAQTTSIRYYLLRAIRYKILRNLTLESRLELLSFESFEGVKESSFEEGLIEIEVQSVQMNHLTKTIHELPARQKEAIHLRFYQNFSNEEIAQIMGVNYKSACRFLYIAIKKLKANLKISVS
jgi:RNA polymerase sigma factor (sigma-70 family)